MKKSILALFLVLFPLFLEAGVKLNITIKDRVVVAHLEDNTTTRALLEKLPMSIKMLDLYERELCYHFGANALPVESFRSDGYEVGDLIYWAPRGSFVIMYKQNGERFSRVHLGNIKDDVSFMNDIGDIDVRVEVANE